MSLVHGAHRPVGFAHLTEPIPSPRALRPECTRELDAAIVRALAKDPAARMASALEFRAAMMTPALAGA